jgi:hypothetical protein
MQCEDFRATREDHNDVLVLVMNEFPFLTSLHMRVSAQNSPAPVDVDAKLIVEKRKVGWTDNVVLNLLPEEIAADITEMLK